MLLSYWAPSTLLRFQLVRVLCNWDPLSGIKVRYTVVVQIVELYFIYQYLLYQVYVLSWTHLPTCLFFVALVRGWQTDWTWDTFSRRTMNLLTSPSPSGETFFPLGVDALLKSWPGPFGIIIHGSRAWGLVWRYMVGKFSPKTVLDLSPRQAPSFIRKL